MPTMSTGELGNSDFLQSATARGDPSLHGAPRQRVSRAREWGGFPQRISRGRKCVLKSLRPYALLHVRSGTVRTYCAFACEDSTGRGGQGGAGLSPLARAPDEAHLAGAWLRTVRARNPSPTPRTGTRSFLPPPKEPLCDLPREQQANASRAWDFQCPPPRWGQGVPFH